MDKKPEINLSHDPLLLAGMTCFPPEIPKGMILFPDKDEYKVGQSLILSCSERDLVPQPHSSFKCGNSLTWEPPLPADLRCTSGTTMAHFKLQRNIACCATDMQIKTSMFILLMNLKVLCLFVCYTAERPVAPDGQCRQGQKLQNSQCVCIERESCL